MFQSRTNNPALDTRMPGGGIELAEASTPSLIGKDLTIVGNAFSEGHIQISGEFQGDIQCTHLQIGERARITGNCVADEIVVSGQVKGTLRGRRITLESKSRIEGDIYHRSLSIEEGAVFAGRSHQTASTGELPVKGAAKPAELAPPKPAAA
jgi:cytoskeletal protein CcmA (bactofilin family)